MGETEVVNAIRVMPTVVMVGDGRHGCLIARNADNRTGYVMFNNDDSVLEAWPLTSLGYYGHWRVSDVRKEDKS